VAQEQAAPGERPINNDDDLAFAAVEPHPLEREAAASGPGLVDEVIEELVVGRDRGGGRPKLVRDGGQLALVLKVAQQVAVLRVLRVGPVRVGRPVQDKAA